MIKRTQYSLLFVEDDALVCRVAIAVLKPYFKNIYEAKDGEEALAIYKEKKPDIIITDIEMPNMDGLSFCKKIREKNRKIPIIITTAYTTTGYLLEAISLNLIKYLVKPVKEEELFEALKSCVEHIEVNNPSIITINKKIKFDILNHTLMEDNSIISLTESQYLLLSILIKHQGRIVSYTEIENHIWVDKVMSSDALRSLVRDVRKIIGKDSISNISKYGYRIHFNG